MFRIREGVHPRRQFYHLQGTTLLVPLVGRCNHLTAVTHSSQSIISGCCIRVKRSCRLRRILDGPAHCKFYMSPGYSVHVQLLVVIGSFGLIAVRWVCMLCACCLTLFYGQLVNINAFNLSLTGYTRPTILSRVLATPIRDHGFTNTLERTV